MHTVLHICRYTVKHSLTWSTGVYYDLLFFLNNKNCHHNDNYINIYQDNIFNLIITYTLALYFE